MLLGGTTDAATTRLSVALPTMVRTGTGDISIAATRDVVLKDQTAPGVIYTAGVNTAPLSEPEYQLVNGSVVASNPDGFLEPRVLIYGAQAVIDQRNSGFAAVFGPPTAAAFPYRAGDIKVVAQRDIVGVGNASATVFFDDDSNGNGFNSSRTLAAYQYY